MGILGFAVSFWTRFGVVQTCPNTRLLTLGSNSQQQTNILQIDELT